jgi:hypothetical protein
MEPTNDKNIQTNQPAKLDRERKFESLPKMLQMEISQESITNSTVEHKFKLSEDVMQLLNGRNQKWLMVGYYSSPLQILRYRRRNLLSIQDGIKQRYSR